MYKGTSNVFKFLVTCPFAKIVIIFIKGIYDGVFINNIVVNNLVSWSNLYSCMGNACVLINIGTGAEFDLTKDNIINSTLYLDKIEELYNNMLNEYQSRK